MQRHSPSGGPALSFTGLLPDLHHYKGSFGGRVFPLWLDRAGKIPNIKPALLSILAALYGSPVTAPEIMAYVAAVAAQPAYVERFGRELVQPGLRIPFTSEPALFAEAAELGRAVIWLHTFGERFADPAAGRPAGPPRLPAESAPMIPKDGAIPYEPDRMPDAIDYDAARHRLIVGEGHIDNVPKAVWDYAVSGVQVLVHWFSYRRRDRSRPVIGDRRAPSPLDKIQPQGWLSEYTSELLDILHVLGRLVEMEPRQAELLARICDGGLIGASALASAGAFDNPGAGRKGSADSRQGDLEV